jgi:acyl carrier protein
MIPTHELLASFERHYRRGRNSRRSVRTGDRLYDDLGIDSLLASELLVALEDDYDVALLHDPRVWQVGAVGELLELVNALAFERVEAAA